MLVLRFGSEIFVLLLRRIRMADDDAPSLFFFFFIPLLPPPPYQLLQSLADVRVEDELVEPRGAVLSEFFEVRGEKKKRH